MTGLPIDHVAIAVHSIAEARAAYESLTGTSCSTIEEVPSQDVNVAFVGRLELVEPRGPDNGVARFLDRRGPGLHHVAYRTEDIRAELDRLTGLGYEAIDTEPRHGAHGLVAFLHPRSTGGVLIELVQR